MKRLIGLVLVCVPVALAVSACVYDPDDRCGPHQTQFPNDRCACEPGFVPGSAGCVPCAEKEEEVNGECVCADGFARPADGGECEEIPAALGTACDTESQPCPDGPFSLCHATEGSDGYCTSVCSDDRDCTGGYRCHADGTDSYCRQPPPKYLEHCDSDADCAEDGASLCEVIQAHQCFVPCSAGKTSGCFDGDVCCNVVVYTMCIPADACAERGAVVE